MCHRTSTHSSPIIEYRRRFRRHSYTFDRSGSSNRIGLDSRPPLMFNKVVAIQPLHCLDGGCFQMGGSRCSYGRSRSLQQLTHGWIRSERVHLRLEHLDRICHLLYFFASTTGRHSHFCISSWSFMTPFTVASMFVMKVCIVSMHRRASRFPSSTFANSCVIRL